MKPTTPLVLAAITSCASAQLSVIQAILLDVQTKVVALSIAAQQYNGSGASNWNVLVAERDLVLTTEDQHPYVWQSEPLDASAINGVAKALVDLATASYELAGNFTQMRPLVEKAQQCEQIGDLTSLFPTEGATLVKAVADKVPEGLRNAADAAGYGVIRGLSEAFYVFAKGNCTDAPPPPDPTRTTSSPYYPPTSTVRTTIMPTGAESGFTALGTHYPSSSKADGTTKKTRTTSTSDGHAGNITTTSPDETSRAGSSPTGTGSPVASTPATMPTSTTTTGPTAIASAGAALISALGPVGALALAVAALVL